ncbi:MULTISPECIES: SDR family NAD(P)-dependent oxidoreductase [Lacticaseibacillus]|uniref:SDR family NAD(P)-dependent oxidoreductase n=1 Tax=Lacticaseibacillus hegangensis TaxID=2486010 RepID=A0ABW4CWA0_9LACO|nr:MULTISPECIES: SDR family NAD(P)-dependent oxidoreductase [Lacticaseibacillus]
MANKPIVSLITGAERGLGLQYAKNLGKAGHVIIIGAYDMTAGAAALKELQDAGLTALLCHCDITDQAAVDETMATIKAKYGYLNILLNNAGISSPAFEKPSETSDAHIEKCFATNFYGTNRVIRAAVPLLEAADWAKVINMTSDLSSLTRAMDAKYGYSKINDLPYQASKTAVNALTMGYAKEFAGTHITVNSVNPGMTATDLVNKKAFEANGAQSVEAGAKAATDLALAKSNDVNGEFLEAAGKIAW